MWCHCDPQPSEQRTRHQLFCVHVWVRRYDSVLAERKMATERCFCVGSISENCPAVCSFLLLQWSGWLQWINSRVSACVKRKSGGEAPNVHRLQLVPCSGGRSQECSWSARKLTSLQRGEKLNHWRSAEEVFCWFSCSWLFLEETEETEKMSPLNLLPQWTVS